MDAPLVSVIIATKNAGRYLRQALDSVAGQTYWPYEIIIVDDRSSDDTLSIARTVDGVRCLPQIGQGLASAWNQGIEAAQGELIAFLDSDDRWTSNKLEVQAHYLRQQSEMPCVIARVKFFMEPGQAYPTKFDPKLLAGDYVARMPGALLSRRSLFEQIGKFDPHLVITPDIDWFARLKDAGLPLPIIQEVLIHKRVHQSNLSYVTAQTTLIEQELLQLLKRSIDRQRGKGKPSD